MKFVHCTLEVIPRSFSFSANLFFFALSRLIYALDKKTAIYAGHRVSTEAGRRIERRVRF